MSFFWYQMTGGEDTWLEALSEHREKTLKERRPAFMTVLDAHTSPEASWDRDEYAKMKYSGPLYFDFDAEKIETTIPEFQKFLEGLVEMGVNLKSLRLYATGGRGFHIEIPATVFMGRVPKTGVTALPYVYREMAMQMVVDTLDMRVYTGRKGRMWRTPGVERSNGKFKVPILVEDALMMTPELYEQLCAAPAPEPERDLPELNSALAAMFIKCQSKMEDGLKRRSKGNADQALLLKFKGQFPPTLERIMRGEGLAPGVGFQKLSMQLAITANALGKTADQLVEAAEGLCKSHEGDSSRYNSPRKRKEELRRMWEYTHDNPCYGYSRGAVRSLVDVDTPTSDLDGLAGGSSAAVGSVPDGDEDEVLTDELEAELNSAHSALIEGLMITGTGIHKRTAEGAKTICNISFRKPMLLLDAEDSMVLGIEADLMSDGVPAGRHSIPGRAFTSRANLSAFCSNYGGIFSGSDTQAGAVSLMLTRSAKKGKRIVYALHKEGLDLIQNPLVKDRPQRDVVWAHKDEVVTDNEDAHYVFQPAVSSLPIFSADVHRSVAMVNTPDTLAWVRNLLAINDPTVVAQMLGWFVSCFHKPFYHAAYQQFPLLHPNGPAGSGKTMTASLLARMFYLTSDVVIKSCSTSTKSFALKAALTGSSSVPLLLDEYKPSEMGAVRTAELQGAFRLSYNGGTGSSGGMTRGNASGSFRDITDYTYSTPVCFMAESQEMQTAIVQRSLPVGFAPEQARAHRDQWLAARAGQDHMSSLGRLILKYSFRETVDSRRAALDPLVSSLRDSFDNSINDRQVYNMAIVLAGLDYLDGVLATVFGGALKGQLAGLKQSMYDHKAELNVSAMSEAAKMMNDLALISRTEDSDSEFALREGVEYIVTSTGSVEILMRETFVKYFSWCKRKGFEPYYASTEAFMSAMGKFSAMEDKLCMTSALKRSGQARVFRFSVSKLTAEGVETFRSKALDK
jgi:hypothetical protein